MHILAYKFVPIHMYKKKSGGENLMENQELNKAIFGLFREIAEKEKKKALNSNDYATAFVAAIIEGLLREAELSAC
jgi:hypothetical protein